MRNHEEALRRKDGSTVYVMVNAFAVRDAKNKVTQFRGLMLDITDAEDLSGRTAAGARFFRKDPEQHAKPDSGGGHGGSGQLCQPPLARYGI